MLLLVIYDLWNLLVLSVKVCQCDMICEIHEQYESATIFIVN